MLSERDVDHLREILRQIELTDKFLGTMTLEEFETDELRLYAVVRCRNHFGSFAASTARHEIETSKRAMAGHGRRGKRLPPRL
jgi:uncharacterized protein with HEPN domain